MNLTRYTINNGVLLLITIVLIVYVTCSCTDDGSPNESSQNFKVTIDNVFEPKSLIQSGEIQSLQPGQSATFSFHAGKAQYLSLAAMLLETNDLFVSFEEGGILLYDAVRTPLTGDVAVKLKIYDAGTEVNEDPGIGPHQAARQSMPDAGLVEENTIMLINEVDDGFDYPKAKEIISLELEHNGVSQFIATVTNTSNTSQLSTTLSAFVWAIHSHDARPIFSTGTKATLSLEKLAEDGNNSAIFSEFESETGLESNFSGGAFSIDPSNLIFPLEDLASEMLEKLAEDGIPSGFNNVFNTPLNDTRPRSISIGEAFQFSFTASPGDRFSLASMLVESNDWFIGINSYPLFTNGAPIVGNLTNQVNLYDAGTEVDEFPGAGNSQGSRQGALNSGLKESVEIRLINPSLDLVPPINKMVHVTIELE